MTNRRALFFLLLSVVFGLAAVVSYQSSLQKAKENVVVPVVHTTPVVMAKESLNTGVAIQPSQLEVIEWPSEFVPAGGMQAPMDVAARIPRRKIEAGEPILEQMLLEEGRQSGLAALIEADHRAMSVKVDTVVGVGGFVQPGSRVDVLAQMRTVNREMGAEPYNRTILQNVRVLAIDQNFERVDGAEPLPASVVTLEVDPVEAQLLAYASAEGRLQLALRNEIDDTYISLRSTTPKDFRDEIPKPARKKVAKAPRRKSIESIRGSDVSRQYL